MTEPEFGDEDFMDISDLRVPEQIRTHGARFKKPGCTVAEHQGDWWIFAEDGELLDIASPE